MTGKKLVADAARKALAETGDEFTIWVFFYGPEGGEAA
jgi:hypothetical protein